MTFQHIEIKSSLFDNCQNPKNVLFWFVLFTSVYITSRKNWTGKMQYPWKHGQYEEKRPKYLHFHKMENTIMY